MTEAIQVEASGETVGEAKWSALRELEKLQPGIDKTAVRFQVLSEGERGLLGVGYTPARVIASVDLGALVPAAGPAEDESALGAHVREVLERILEAIGVRARIELRENDESLVASVGGRELGLVIGKHGQTIDAIQYLVNAIVWRGQSDDRKPVVVDAAGYRARREATLDTLAVRNAERAVSSGRTVELEPMTAVERKVVHVRLKEFPGVTTRSEGTEPNRFVVIEPAAPAARPRSGPVEGVSGEPGGSPGDSE
jgi:spoIIIJ-associated protein